MISTEAGERLLQYIPQWYKEMSSILSLNESLQQLELRRNKLRLDAEELRQVEMLRKADLETLLDNAEKIGGEKHKLRGKYTKGMSELYVKIISDIAEIQSNFSYNRKACPMGPVSEEATVTDGLEKTTQDQADSEIQEHNFYVRHSHLESPPTSRPSLLKFLISGKQKISEPIGNGNGGTVQTLAGSMSSEQ